MKKAMLIMQFALMSLEANATREWIGEVPVSKIFYAKSNGNCGENGGPCLMLKFGAGYKACEWISIPEADHHFTAIQNLALVSLTAGKPLGIYGSSEHCTNPDLISINNVTLQ